MPAQLVHIKYALKYLEGRPELDRSDFLRGTVFPDIRRMAGLERTATHKMGVERAEVDAQPDAWEAGRLLHSALDRAWNLYFRGIGIPASDYPDKIWSAVKLAEESVMCGRLESREEAVEALRRPPVPQELSFGLEPETLERWHAFIIWKLQTPFILDNWREHAVEIHWEAAKMERLLDRVEGIRGDHQWQQRLAGLQKELGYEA